MNTHPMALTYNQNKPDRTQVLFHQEWVVRKKNHAHTLTRSQMTAMNENDKLSLFCTHISCDMVCWLECKGSDTDYYLLFLIISIQVCNGCYNPQHTHGHLHSHSSVWQHVRQNITVVEHSTRSIQSIIYS